MAKHVYILFRQAEIHIPNDTFLLENVPEKYANLPCHQYEFTYKDLRCHGVFLDQTQTPSTQPSSPSEPGWIRIRNLLSGEYPALESLIPLAIKAYGITQWRAKTRFCQTCGSPLEEHGEEIALGCKTCNALYFPRISPAVIVVVHKGNSILLARHRDRISDIFTCLAGYLEHGETLEECVVREVFEETGLRVGKVQYAGSQSWPFPDQFMIGFHAHWESGDIAIDEKELLEARWFDYREHPAIPAPGTIAWRLIRGDLANVCPG